MSAQFEYICVSIREKTSTLNPTKTKTGYQESVDMQSAHRVECECQRRHDHTIQGGKRVIISTKTTYQGEDEAAVPIPPIWVPRKVAVGRGFGGGQAVGGLVRVQAPPADLIRRNLSMRNDLQYLLCRYPNSCMF